MFKSLKLGVGLLAGVSAVSICLAAALFIVRTQEQGRRIKAEQALTHTLSAKEEIEKELTETLEVKQAIELQLKLLDEEVGTLEAELEKEKAEKSSVVSNLEAKLSEFNKIKANFDKEKEEKAALTKKLAAMENNYELLRAELDKLTLAKQTLEKKLKQTLGKAEVELEKIVVTPEELASMEAISREGIKAGAPLGRVMVVNRDFNFVVANLGDKSNIEAGQLMGVFRNGKFIAKVEVERVYADMSTATILAEVEDIQEGDSISLLGE